MKGKGRLPQYAVPLIVLNVLAEIISICGLRLFIPEGRKAHIYPLNISKFLRMSHYIRSVVTAEDISLKNYGATIYRRNAL